ncbi:hypothetical protein ACFX1X_029977 [Malus domestica]
MELVAKPSIIFMDELTLGLDARAVSIIMCLLAAFRKKEEVDLCHPLGHQSYKLVEYFEGILGVAKIKEGLQSNYLDVGGQLGRH